MKPSNKCLVWYKDFHGKRGVLFMAADDDDRIGKSMTVVAPASECRYDRKAKTLTVSGRRYQVFSDWSVKELDDSRVQTTTAMLHSRSVIVFPDTRRRIPGGEVVTVTWAQDSTDPKMILSDGTVHPAQRHGFRWEEPICNLTF